jgi:hypothetical protein
MSTAVGATLVTAPEGTAVLAAGLAGGRLMRQTALGCFMSTVVLFPVLIRRRGWRGAVLASSVALPIFTKRLLGNARHDGERDHRPRVLLARLLFDRDTMASPPKWGR